MAKKADEVCITRKQADTIISYVADLQEHISELEEAFGYEPEKGKDELRDSIKADYPKFKKAMDALRS